MSKIAPVAVLIFSVFIAAFLGGALTAHFNVFPYPQIRGAGLTLRALVKSQSAFHGKMVGSTEVPADDAERSRWSVYDSASDRLPVIVNGGLNQFLDLCAGDGCLAVAYDATGKVSHTWPYRPAEIFAVDSTGGSYPHELLGFDPRVDVYPLSVQRYSDGDILVNFQARTGRAFPFAMGVSRIGPDGKPVWTRFDYSHHWSTLAKDGTAYVPGLKVGEGGLRFTIGSPLSRKRFLLDCKSGSPQLDTVQIIDNKGNLSEEIDLVPLLMQSNWAGLLPESTDFCDPLHLNYIDLIGTDAGPGLEPGDLVLSLRNLSRFAILDGKTRRIKRMIAGGFVQQHSVHHLRGSKFLIFDNRGGDGDGPASRIVELDIATGVERRVFPNKDAPEPYTSVFSNVAGYLDISPDRKRVIASFTHTGRAFEVDIASGKLLAVFDNLHSLSEAPDVPAEKRKQAQRFSIYGLSYLLQ